MLSSYHRDTPNGEKMKRKILPIIIMATAILFLSGCASIPKNAEAVTGFRLSRYVGTWYEIARTDNKYEKNLENVSATYSLSSGGIKVVNKGYDAAVKEWKTVEGKASFRGDDSIGELKVSFFGPYYAGYNIIKLSDDYSYAMVIGESTDYLWILSREKTIPKDVLDDFLATAKQIGVDTDNLIWVHQD